MRRRRRSRFTCRGRTTTSCTGSSPAGPTGREPGQAAAQPDGAGHRPLRSRALGPRERALVRNPRFSAWTPDRPDGFPDRISFRYQPTKAQIAGIERGAADIAIFDGPTDFAARVRARHGARLHADPLQGPRTRSSTSARRRSTTPAPGGTELRRRPRPARRAHGRGDAPADLPDAAAGLPGLHAVVSLHGQPEPRGNVDGPGPGEGAPARHRLGDAWHEGRVLGLGRGRGLRALHAQGPESGATAAPCGASPVSAGSRRTPPASRTLGRRSACSSGTRTRPRR